MPSNEENTATQHQKSWEPPQDPEWMIPLQPEAKQQVTPEKLRKKGFGFLNTELRKFPHGESEHNRKQRDAIKTYYEHRAHKDLPATSITEHYYAKTAINTAKQYARRKQLAAPNGQKPRPKRKLKPKVTPEYLTWIPLDSAVTKETPSQDTIKKCINEAYRIVRTKLELYPPTIGDNDNIRKQIRAEYGKLAFRGLPNTSIHELSLKYKRDLAKKNKNSSHTKPNNTPKIAPVTPSDKMSGNINSDSANHYEDTRQPENSEHPKEIENSQDFDWENDNKIGEMDGLARMNIDVSEINWNDPVPEKSNAPSSKNLEETASLKDAYPSLEELLLKQPENTGLNQKDVATHLGANIPEEGDDLDLAFLELPNDDPELGAVAEQEEIDLLLAELSNDDSELGAVAEQEELDLLLAELPNDDSELGAVAVNAKLEHEDTEALGLPELPAPSQVFLQNLPNNGTIIGPRDMSAFGKPIPAREVELPRAKRDREEDSTSETKQATSKKSRGI